MKPQNSTKSRQKIRFMYTGMCPWPGSWEWFFNLPWRASWGWRHHWHRWGRQQQQARPPWVADPCRLGPSLRHFWRSWGCPRPCPGPHPQCPPAWSGCHTWAPWSCCCAWAPRCKWPTRSQCRRRQIRGRWWAGKLLSSGADPCWWTARSSTYLQPRMSTSPSLSWTQTHPWTGTWDCPGRGPVWNLFSRGPRWIQLS